MPSKLPVLKAHTTALNVAKMKYIAAYNKRSVAKEIIYLSEKHISDFELKHGEILIKD